MPTIIFQNFKDKNNNSCYLLKENDTYYFSSTENGSLSEKLSITEGVFFHAHRGACYLEITEEGLDSTLYLKEEPSVYMTNPTERLWLYSPSTSGFVKEGLAYPSPKNNDILAKIIRAQQSCPVEGTVAGIKSESDLSNAFKLG